MSARVGGRSSQQIPHPLKTLNTFSWHSAGEDSEANSSNSSTNPTIPQCVGAEQKELSTMDDGSTGILTEAAAMSSSALASPDAGVGISTPTDAAVDTNVDSTTDVATETGDASVEGSDKSQESDTNPDGSLKEFSLEKNGKVDFKALGKAIQSFKDASPENAIAAKQIHGALRRLEAFGQEFGGGINEAREVKSFLRELVGAEGNAPVTLQQAKEAYTNQKGIISSVEESDQLLYAGDGKLIDNIYEQMKNDGKQESFVSGVKHSFRSTTIRFPDVV
jgi:hypothetical protein